MTERQSEARHAGTHGEELFEWFLTSIADMTEDDLRAAMAEIPPEIVERLKEGPKRLRYSCGICQAFGRGFYESDTDDPEDPMWRVFGYHEIPKLQMENSRQLHVGQHANDVYRRCLETYRAAGWTGTAPEPDA